MSTQTNSIGTGKPSEVSLAQIRHTIADWRRALVDVGGRNPLLFFRHLPSGTLDLGEESGADRDVVAALLDGRLVRLSQCFPDGGDADVIRRARRIRGKAQEHKEERGIDTLRIGRWFATWDRHQSPGPTPRAPVLLATAELTPQGGLAEEFTLSVTDEWEVNPSLMRLLERDFGVDIGEPGETELLDAESGLLDVERLRRLCESVPGFAVEHGLVLGTFSYAKLPMVRDLEDAEDAIAHHPLVAAIAGDAYARTQLDGAQRHAAENKQPIGDALSPRDEFLVLDADSTQSEVISSAISGANLVVVGPPGTGKSQTIANLLAALTARGHSTLFVAEKRAAIDAVVKRLRDVHLDDLVIDLHDGSQSRRQTAEQLARALRAIDADHDPTVERAQRVLVQKRKRLDNARLALHHPREPWGIAVYELQSRILDMEDSGDGKLRLRGSVLEALVGETLEQAADELRDYVSFDGPTLDAATDAPWSAAHRASIVPSREHADEIARLLDDLGDSLITNVEHQLVAFTKALKINQPSTVAETRALLDAFQALQPFADQLNESVFETADLGQLIAALEPGERGPIGRLTAHITNGAYRAAKKRAAGLTTASAFTPADARQRLLGFSRASETWHNASGSNADASVWEISAADCESALASFSSSLGQLCERAALDNENDPNWETHRAQLELLQSERRTLSRLPRLHELREQLSDHGLAAIARDAHERGLDGDQAAQELHHVWTRSVLETVEAADPDIVTFRADARDKANDEFRTADKQHIDTGAERVMRAWARIARAVCDAHPDQLQLVRQEVRKKRKLLATRVLVERAPNVLTALKPCWVMSPLVVAQLLPIAADPLFDVVVFDEASQIPPADAIPSLLRGRQTVVAGDPQQLPPTSFFTGSSEDEEDDEDEDSTTAPVTEGIESILEAMQPLLPSPQGERMLGWHYRSKDERLIAFSNHHVYDRSLTTFPGALPGDCVAHIEVPLVNGAELEVASYSPEVDQVVDLILNHAAHRPDETLGVIALGLKHADRIAETLRLARRDHPELEHFFSEANAEPFFVKNLERVQGDERDAIILTVGYSRNKRGEMRYRFGPINQDVGFRRLNVAVTRAKRRMTIVSSFSHKDMDPDRIRGRGVQMLRDYIEYASGGGRDLGEGATEVSVLNPFEKDIRERLEAHGLDLRPQYGVSGYRIDFAVMHPEEPGRPVLAIEADGARYHSTPATRDRDRLRQDHLERLGWRFHRIWSTEWFRNPEREVERCLAAWRAAVESVESVENGAESPAAEHAAESLAAAARQTPQRGPRPSIGPPRATIADYGEAELVGLVRWIRSDGKLRTMKELLQDTIEELGYRKRGDGIEAAVSRAIAAANLAGDEHERR